MDIPRCKKCLSYEYLIRGMVRDHSCSKANKKIDAIIIHKNSSPKWCYKRIIKEDKMDCLIRPLQQIETEIDFYKSQFATNTIEIGKRLVEAKSQLAHGEWGKWLKEKIYFSDRTARRFMQVATEFSNWTSLTDLNQTKVFALLDVPSEEREEFISQLHEVDGQAKTVDEMTTRELQKVIKQLKSSEEENQLLKENQNMLQLNVELATQKSQSLEANYNNEKNLRESLETTVEELKNKPKDVLEVPTEVIPDDYEKLKRDVEIYRTSYNDVLKSKQLTEKELEAYKISAKNAHNGTPIDFTDIYEFRLSVNDFLRKVSAIIYQGKEFKTKADSELNKWNESTDLLQKFVDDLKSAIRGNDIGATTIYLNSEEVN